MSKYIPVEPEKWAEMVKAMAEVTRLKAEVERLTKAEVERLRKEGEAMYPNLGPGWSHNAKEGKQP